MTIRLTLPLPPKDCSPNARGHWATKARAVKAYRQRAEMEARRIPASQRAAWTAATTRAVFYLRDRRRRDRDNLAASLKAAWDGLTDAGVLADDHGLRHEPTGVEVDRASPRVEIEVWPMAA